MDGVKACMKERFDQPDLHIYIGLHYLSLKAIKSQPWGQGVREVYSIYGDDLDKYKLEA